MMETFMDQLSVYLKSCLRNVSDTKQKY